MSTTVAAARPRRAVRLTLRALIVLIAVIAVPVAWKTNRARAQRRAVDALERKNAFVLRDFETLGPGGRKTGAPWAPTWFRRRLGDEYFGEVKDVRFYPDVKTVKGPDGSLHYEAQPREADLAPLEVLVSLQELTVQDAPITDADLAHLAGLKRLKRLDLSNVEITDAGLVHLSGLEDLQSLTITDAGVFGPGLAHLKGLAHLDSLNLNGSPITDAGLVQSAGSEGAQGRGSVRDPGHRGRPGEPLRPDRPARPLRLVADPLRRRPRPPRRPATAFEPPDRGPRHHRRGPRPPPQAGCSSLLILGGPFAEGSPTPASSTSAASAASAGSWTCLGTSITDAGLVELSKLSAWRASTSRGRRSPTPASRRRRG